MIFHLENRPMEEQSKQLNEVKQDIAIFLLHPDDVGQGEGLISVDASVGRSGPGEEAKLEEALYHHCHLRNRGDSSGSCLSRKKKIIVIKKFLVNKKNWVLL